MASYGRAITQFGTGLEAGITKRQKLQRETEAHALDVRQKSAQVAEAEALAQPEVLETKVAALNAQNQELINSQARTESYNAFRAYNADSDVRHLNTVLQRNPTLRAIYKDIASIDKLNPVADQNLMLQNGFDPNMFEDPAIDKEAFLHRYVKVTGPDGTKEITDLQQLMIGSGYAQYADKQELDTLLAKSKVQKTLAGKEIVPSALEKKSGFVSETLDLPIEETTRKFYEAEIAGVTPGRISIAEQRTEQLFTKFGSEEEFYSTDFSVSKNRRKAAADIEAIKLAQKIKIPAADRADLKAISQLVASGAVVAEELTPAATGLLDNFTSDVSRYLDDNPDIGKAEGRAAFNAYRNALLRSFGGTAMSESEVKNFNKAFGTLAQKFPSAISQFKQAIGQTKAKLETMMTLNNPILAHYYMGGTLENVEDISLKLEDTLAAINRAGKAQAKPDWRANAAKRFGDIR